MAAVRRSPVVLFLTIGGLAAAFLAEALIRLREFPGAAHLVGLALLYVAWWVALTRAVWRVCGRPIRWFTILLPVAGGLLVLIGEVATAIGRPGIGEVPSSIGGLLMIGVPVVTTFIAYRKKMQWKSGLVAWSLLLYQAAVSIAAFSGILFGTFGDESRADELVVVAFIPPLIALVAATALGPNLTVIARVTPGGLVMIAVPAVLFSTSDGGVRLLLAFAAVGGLLLIVDAIGKEQPRSALGARHTSRLTS